MNELSPVQIPPGHRWSDEEWALRVQLADCYHAIDYLGWTEMMIFNHISVRVPGDKVCYLVNPFGLTYDEVTPKNLLKVDLDGNLAEPSDFKANPAGFALHSAIHGVRHDAQCVIHTHTNAVSAIALKQGGLGHDDFLWRAAVRTRGLSRLRRHHALGRGEGPDARQPRPGGRAGAAQPRCCGLWRRHSEGVHAVVDGAARAAEIQCQAGMLPGPNTELTNDVRQHCADTAARLVAGDAFATKVFDATVRKMRASKR